MIRKLKADTGLSILVIDKSIRELREVCDNAAILERGKTVWSGRIADLTDDITNTYIGV